jgi:hypothetical protein
MKSTRVNSLTADAYLVSSRVGELLKCIWPDLQSLEAEDRKDVAQIILTRVMQPTDSCHSLSETANHEAIVESHDAGLQATRYGAPGPQKRTEYFNPEEPLDFWLMKSSRNFSSHRKRKENSRP